MHLNTRSGVELGNDEAENEDSDSVELEKSNVLLMGPTGSGLIWCCFFVMVFVWDQMLTRAAVLIFMYFFYLGCKDRENVTCENTSSCCECAIRRCWCNNVNTGKFIAWYGYLTVCLVIRKPYAKVWGAAYVTPYQKKMDIEQILLITLSFTPSPPPHTHTHNFTSVQFFIL